MAPLRDYTWPHGGFLAVTSGVAGVGIRFPIKNILPGKNLRLRNTDTLMPMSLNEKELLNPYIDFFALV